MTGPGPKTRILVVEDETIVARDIELQLEALGYEQVGQTSTGEQAVVLAGELRPDLVLMDVQPAGAIDGIAAAEAIRTQYGVPVVFMTAFAGIETVTRAKASESFGYILKPFAERELRIVLEMALSRHLIYTELRESEERARTLIEWSPEAIVVHRNGNILYVNPAALLMFGLTSASEVVGTSIFERIHPQSKPFVQERMRDLSLRGVVTPMDLLRGLKQDGSIIEVEARSVMITYNGAPAIHSSMHDITARVRAEASLRLKSAALEAAASAIVITDREGTIEWANSAFTTFTGYSVAEAIGRKPGALLKSGKHDKAFYRSLWDTILTGSLWHGEITNRRKNGSLYFEEMTITPLKNEAGKITHFIAVKQDITERKRLEEQFRQSQKMESIGRLAGGIAHDFNNMLGVILGNLELAIPRAEQSQVLHAELLEIQDAAKRSAILTKQLLAFARRQPTAPRVLDLRAAVTTIVPILQRLVGERISIAVAGSKKTWPVSIDPSQLDQVLINLIVNARDAIAGAGTVTLTTTNCVIDARYAAHVGATPGEYVRLLVSDDGCGIADSVLQHVFEPFFTTKAVGVGTGLGLSTVYGTVRQHFGFVTASSEPERGTTFEVCLPRHLGEEALKWTPPETAIAGRGWETVLVVEDEAGILRLTTKALTASGYTVLSAASPAEALQVAVGHAGEIHLILTDVVMPGMNGQELTDRLLSLRPGLKRLFMSGYPAEVMAEGGVLPEGVSFIQKPFLVTDLRTRVRDLLDAG